MSRDYDEEPILCAGCEEDEAEEGSLFCWDCAMMDMDDQDTTGDDTEC